VCNLPPSLLCPPNTPGDWVSCDLGCCPPSEPFTCDDNTFCYADPDQAAANCGDAGLGCSSCVSTWCGSPSDVGACGPGAGYCGSGSCCDLSTPWFCSSGGGTCYANQSDAVHNCGNNCTYCTPTCVTSSSSGLCGTLLTCDSACCPSTLPFYCASNGLCFAANAEAYQSCGGSCVACVQ
jgi:hypothetical protein